MAKDDDWIKDLFDEVMNVIDPDLQTANKTEDLAFREEMREDFVRASMKEMAENGTYKYFQKFRQGRLYGWDEVEEEYDVDDISDEIKDQFVDDDWKHILPFKWSGK